MNTSDRPTTNEPQVLTLPQTAELLQVSKGLIYSLAQSGALPGRKVGKLWRFDRSALAAWISAPERRVDVDSTRPIRPTGPVSPRNPKPVPTRQRNLANPVHLPEGPLHRPSYAPVKGLVRAKR